MPIASQGRRPTVRAALAALPVLSFAMWSAPPVMAAETGTPLVGPRWVRDNLHRVVVLDVREDAASFVEEGHLPGARLVYQRDVELPPASLPMRAALHGLRQSFENAMRGAGLNRRSIVVVTTRGLKPSETFLGTRLYLLLKIHGHSRVHFLDGGTGGWSVEGFPLERGGPTTTRVGNWSAKPPTAGMLAGTDTLDRARQSRSHQLIAADVLSEEVSDAVGPPSRPSVVLANPTMFVVDAMPVRFRTRDEIMAATVDAGIAGQVPLIAYCGTGRWSSGVWFVLSELVGRHNVSVSRLDRR